MNPFAAFVLGCLVTIALLSVAAVGAPFWMAIVGLAVAFAAAWRIRKSTKAGSSFWPDTNGWLALASLFLSVASLAAAVDWTFLGATGP
ncbi:hypothetical protein KTR66_16210 [Roseococcus sp. SDR]|uniref:hypothetical protein n=1 Tax=Roseococcus sp. SDR TaxID=2835532 RepID=UPI001BCD638C|nr:hypothetical protein [Roseococcus sp. SDR]MBS7791547.1 hypothetical protein [Roseococcus sp. SDR]MBV1846861.1 hypothetical protein [Roseococcus sp. SDR]